MSKREQIGEREKVYFPPYNNTAAKTDSNKTQSGGLPERHKAHLSWPSIVTKKQLEMWTNAQRDGRPAEYRWRPLLNAAVWLTPTTRVTSMV